MRPLTTPHTTHTTYTDNSPYHNPPNPAFIQKASPTATGFSAGVALGVVGGRSNLRPGFEGRIKVAGDAEVAEAIHEDEVEAIEDGVELRDAVGAGEVFGEGVEERGVVGGGRKRVEERERKVGGEGGADELDDHEGIKERGRGKWEWLVMRVEAEAEGVNEAGTLDVEGDAGGGGDGYGRGRRTGEMGD